MKHKLFNFIKKAYDFIDTIGQDKVGIYTAQASFFIILSIFPFILLFFNLIGHASINQNTIIYLIHSYAPDSLKPLFVQVVSEIYEHVSSAAVSITAIAAIWSASKGVLSVMFGLYEIVKIHQKRNYFISRFVSMLYTIIVNVALASTMVLLVFGNKLFNLAISLAPWLRQISIVTLMLRYLLVFLLLVLFFSLIYRLANFKLATFGKVFPGAFFSALGWVVFSYIFSIYVDSFSGLSYMYGSFTAVIVFMLWIYFLIYIMFIGAEINKLLFPETEATVTVKM